MELSVTAILLRLAAVLALVAANGIFIAAEFAIVKARRTRIERMMRSGNRLARSVQRAADNPDAYVAATQLGITMASLGLGWIGEPTVTTLLEPLLVLLPASWQAASLNAISRDTSVREHHSFAHHLRRTRAKKRSIMERRIDRRYRRTAD